MVDTSILGKYFEANRSSERHVQLKEEGEKQIGTILGWEETRQYFDKKPMFWPAKPGEEAQPRMQLTIYLEIDGVKQRLDVPKSKQPGSRMAAINAALAEAKAPLQVGGTLAMKVTKKTPFGKGFTREHEARYQPPTIEKL